MIQLFDMLGQVVLQKDVKNYSDDKIRIDVGSLANSIYDIRITNNSLVVNAKVIIDK
jgi:hypothetical protein